MPIRKVSGGYQYGMHGKIYKNKKDAVKQAVAIHASGFKENETRRKISKGTIGKRRVKSN
jgi:hypothetical protein